MAHIVGCIEAHELTTCKVGANQGAHIILRKSIDAPTPSVPAVKTETHPENDDMDLAIAKAIAAMNEVTKAYFLALADDAAKLFIAKSPADQEAEAAAAKAKDDEAAEKTKSDTALAEKAKSDAEARATVLENKNKSLQDQIDALKTAGEIDKEASSPDFNGYPGGVDAVKAILSTLGGVSAQARKAVVDGLKAQATMATAALGERGGRSDEDIAKSAPGTHAFTTAVKAYAVEKNISIDEATAAYALTPNGRTQYAAALAEGA